MMSMTCGGRASCASARCSTQLRTPASRSVRALSTFRTNNRKTRSTFVVRASDSAPESYTMDYQGALKFLGLNEGASSEDMVRAKNQMISRYQEEEEKLKKVSIALTLISGKQKRVYLRPFSRSLRRWKCTLLGGILSFAPVLTVSATRHPFRISRRLKRRTMLCS